MPHRQIRILHGVVVVTATLLFGTYAAWRLNDVRGEETRQIQEYQAHAAVTQTALLADLETQLASVRAILSMFEENEARVVVPIVRRLAAERRPQSKPLFHSIIRFEAGFGTDVLVSFGPGVPDLLEPTGLCQADVAIGVRETRVLPPTRSAVDGTWLLPLALVRRTANGCDGHVALLDTDSLNGLLTGLSIDFALLTHTDGTILARFPGGDRFTGQPLGRSSVFAAAARQAPSGPLVSVSPVDGQTRVSHYATMSSLPIVVAVGYEYSTIVAAVDRRWRTTHVEIAIGFLVTALLVVLALAFLSFRLRAALNAARQQARSHDLLSFVMNETGQGMWQIDLVHGTIHYASAFRRIVGIDEAVEEEALSAWRLRLHPDDRDAFDEAIGTCRSGASGRLLVRFRVPGRENGWHWMLARGVLYAHGDDFRPERMVGVVSDVTAEEEEAIRMRLAATVFGETSEAIAVTDAENRILTVNPAFERVTGYAAHEVAGRNPGILRSGMHDRAFYGALWATLREKGAWQGEIMNRHKSGRIYPEWLSINVVRNAEGAVLRHVAIFSDITERKASEARIQHLAHYDHLTHLPNRLLLRDRLQQMIAAANRKRTKIALLFIDLDRFKSVNDTYGHEAGDKLLIQAGQRIVGAIRASDTASRQGGDEFVVAVADIGEPDDAAVVAQKIASALSQPFSIDGAEVRVGCSIGVVLYPDDGDAIDLLIRNADISMYEAKQEGRARIRFFTEDLNRRTEERALLETALRRAIPQGELFLAFQPQFETLTGRLCGLEALVRWRHPQEGLISPGRFVPVAESSGLIGALGDEVLRLACRQIRQWRADGFEVPVVGVNVSAVQLNATDFVDTWAGILRQEEADPAWFDAEITETALVTAGNGPERNIQALSDLGCRVSIDDFGTGYSSMVYLRRFSADKIKIDQCFVRNVDTDQGSAAICEAIVNMSRSLGLLTIAEGVETESELAVLRTMGCDEVQGFLLARPLPPETVVTLLPRADPPEAPRLRVAGAE
jgi:diguanylate cyclase (GGDEF)-like protein/PAS domain S-box-containing protein